MSNTGITPSEIASLLGITSQAVYKILKSSDIDCSGVNKRKLISPQDIRKLLTDRGFAYPKKSFSFQIVKGGAGKTSLSSNFAFRASQYGAKVLAIDLDQQGNLTSTLNVDNSSCPVFINLFRNEVSIEESLIEVNDHLHVIPSSLDNSRLDMELAQATSLNIKDLIHDLIEPVRKNYDIIVMDCPPAINRINTAVTCASDLVVIPVNPDQYSMDGMEFTIAEIKLIRKDFKLKNLDYKIIWNKYDAREKLGAVYMHHLIKDPDNFDKILPFVIRTDASIKSAVYESKTVFETNQKRNIKEDLDQLTRELIGLNDWSTNKDKPKEKIKAKPKIKKVKTNKKNTNKKAKMETA